MVYNPELIEDNYMPCVIQARLNGIKGVFVIAPDLNNRGVLIQYHRSQYKFGVNHNVLEIVKHASSGKKIFKKISKRFIFNRNGISESASDCVIGKHGCGKTSFFKITK
jgi:hypothetical protein